MIDLTAKCETAPCACGMHRDISSIAAGKAFLHEILKFTDVRFFRPTLNNLRIRQEFRFLNAYKSQTGNEAQMRIKKLTNHIVLR